MEKNLNRNSRASSIDYEFKIIVCGDSCVGKTSTLKRIKFGVFNENEITTICNNLYYISFNNI